MTHKFHGSLSKTIIHKSSKSFTSRKHKYLAGIQYRTLLNGFPSSRSKDSGCILAEQSSFQQSYRLDPFLEKNEKFEMKREKKRYSSERFLVSLLIRTNVGGSSKVFTSGLSRVVIARLLTEGAALVSRVRAVRASRLKNSRCALLSPSSPLVGSALDRPRRPGRASESEKYFNTVWRNSRKRLNPRDEVRGKEEYLKG